MKKREIVGKGGTWDRLTCGHGFVGGSDLKLIEVGSAMFTLFTSDCEDEMRTRA